MIRIGISPFSLLFFLFTNFRVLWVVDCFLLVVGSFLRVVRAFYKWWVVVGFHRWWMGFRLSVGGDEFSEVMNGFSWAVVRFWG